MPERKQTTKKIADLDFDQLTVEEAIRQLQDVQAKLAINFTTKNFIDVSCSEDYLEITVWGTKLETEDEARTREAVEEARRSSAEAYERAQYERLRAKFENTPQ